MQETVRRLTLNTTIRSVESTVVASELADVADAADAAGLTWHSELEQGGNATVGCISRPTAECSSSSRNRLYWQRRTGRRGVRVTAHFSMASGQHQLPMLSVVHRNA